MAPSITESAPDAINHTAEKIQDKLSATSSSTTEVKADEPAAPATQAATTSNYIREPLKLAGAIDAWKHFDVTPVIGREFQNVDLASVLRAENSDALIRDLAITSKLSLIITCKV